MKVIWTERFTEKVASIFVFWNTNNHSTNYSNKINQLIIKNEAVLIEFPLIGKATDNKKFRYIIIDRFKLFYQVTPKAIYLMAIFDTKEKIPATFKSK